MTADDQAFDLMNEGGENLDLFGQEVDLSDQIINNMPEGSNLQTVMSMVNNLIDDERWVAGFPSKHHDMEVDPQEILKTVIDEVLNDETLSNQYSDLRDEVVSKTSDLYNQMSTTVSEAGRGYEDHWVGDTQAAAFGGMNPLMQEEVSFDPETFDYIDEVAGREVMSFATGKRFELMEE